MEQKFYICKHCGNIIAKVKDTGVPVICCGEPMSEIVPGTTDAAVEKHVPVCFLRLADRPRSHWEFPRTLMLEV